MKMFKRFAAALLAGVMVLAMLTACGGGAGGPGESEFEKKVQDVYMAALNPPPACQQADRPNSAVLFGNCPQTQKSPGGRPCSHAPGEKVRNFYLLTFLMRMETPM